MCKFTVEEGELKKPTVAEGRCGFVDSGSRQKGDDSFKIKGMNSWRNSLLVFYLHILTVTY